MTLADLLLAWYDANKRELPWRKDKDPYKIWVSEIMLQQTRVEAVKPYFEKWMDRFPDIAALAEADEEEVLHCWQGLGYYSRARNLLAGAREVVARYDARLPDNRAETQQIKGIGEYTAGAILSIAYNKREAAVDGNVLRVFSRLFCIEDDIRKQSVKKQITRLVEKELPHGRSGDFNQALMDLGSGVCIPQEPRCHLCPLTTCCHAYKEGLQNKLPERSKDKPPVPVALAAGILKDKDAYLLRRRPAKGTLAGLWEFPSIELAPGEKPAAQLIRLFQSFGLSITVEAPFFQTKHTFSHRVWDITFYSCTLAETVFSVKQTDLRWCPLETWQTVNWAGPNRKAAEWLLHL